MATDPNEFNVILKHFDKLNREERQELMDKLQQRESPKTNRDDSGRTLFEALNERGMAGSIKDAPPDWSTNPKYLEGLGQDDQ